MLRLWQGHSLLWVRSFSPWPGTEAAWGWGKFYTPHLIFKELGQADVESPLLPILLLLRSPKCLQTLTHQSPQLLGQKTNALSPASRWSPDTWVKTPELVHGEQRPEHQLDPEFWKPSSRARRQGCLTFFKFCSFCSQKKMLKAELSSFVLIEVEQCGVQTTGSRTRLLGQQPQLC